MILEFVTRSDCDRLILRRADGVAVSAWKIGAPNAPSFADFIEVAKNPGSLRAWHVQDENGLAEPFDEQFDTLVATAPRVDGTLGVDCWEHGAWRERCWRYGIDPSEVGPEPTTEELMAEIDEILEWSDF